ncbi:hypothetical protein DSM25558_5110 [Agrobacterium sp. DSM 25558]|uniref:hypothetical protein n=1 Tax=Agrobacterium sp. DSM 25558 TaxID=1907665 RepID=UPI000972642F|nr:hypothetical protein [Agrobacterium sp. DSM 25558]SCX31045.1 hypothetical protein DSM25558_5110 [Agrobacterium sp. DSM 25558]
MRLIFAAAITLVAITGIFGAYSTLPSKTTDNDFSNHYLQLARNSPDLLGKVIKSTLPNCLTDAARVLLDDQMIADLATKTFFKSGVLMAEGKKAEQSAKEFIPWIVKQAEPLGPVQKKTYLALVKGELTSPDVILCVHSSIKTLIDKRIDLKASVWDIRT